ncbi:diguanylate cyclase (GGDEF) domain-containing protein [Devosia limi DSM 17137]|uniref:Diguanylate cyclase (GGDEF) domain-containing protein n=1 Tax=Devosia limi DSM 17137 TaxID=1121477 RepID=A0A1M4YAD9_9HYPH|nr:diguanylate cyclase (GGDEF) domain-containing protein [Devosia limi DSM 17137]
MLPRAWFRQLVLVVLVVLAIAAVVHARAVQDSAAAVQDSMRFDVSWIGAQGRIEAGQLEAKVALYAALRRPQDARAAEMFYQILLGRLDSWNVGGYRDFLQASPPSQQAYDELQALLTSVEAEFTDLTKVDDMPALLERLSPVSSIIDRIGAEASISAVAKAAAIRDTLTERQTIQDYLVTTLLIAAGVLLVLTALQNRNLRAAHKAVQQASERYAYSARHDPLTGLPNRTAFSHPDHSLFRDMANRRAAVVVIDLDGFKVVNDTWGHIFGDKLLTAAAHRLRDLVGVRPGNVVARLGGDEFVALLNVSDEAEAVAFANKIIEALKRPFEIDGSVTTIGATAGVALAVDDNWDTLSLMADADLAQSHTKSRNKGTVGLYDPGLRERVERRLTLENQLRTAIEKKEIFPHYQVQVDLQTGALVGVEALARWHHPQLGLISPAEFIPIAEASGQIFNIGKYMIDCACRDALRLPANVPVAVNISVIQIMQGEIMDTVAEALMMSGLAPQRLKLEVTESVMMMDRRRAIAVLSELRYLGVAIALDDFGTGFSSLSYLSTFRWDELKIDRSFLQNLDTDPLGLSIIQAVLVLARKLGAKVIVEGIETDNQLQLLKKTGCHVGQGYFFGRPAPIDTVCELISAMPPPTSAATRRKSDSTR